MRAAMLRRRRRAKIEEIIYAAITATNPTVFVPLEYAVNPDTGEQILFQDSAASVPVVDIGDPDGAVKDINGVIVAQSTDANRPLHGGVGEGAIFDGSGDMLRALESYDFVQNTGVFTAGLRVKMDVIADSRMWLFDTKVATGVNVGWGVYYDNLNASGANQRLRFTIGDGSKFTGHNWDGVISDTEYHTILFTGDGDDYELFIDGVSQGTRPSTVVAGSAVEDLAIGAASNGAATLDGSIQWLALWERTLTATEIEVIS